MKRSFFQAAVTSILLLDCTTWTLTKRLEKKQWQLHKNAACNPPSPGGNTQQDTNCTATCPLSRKHKLGEPDTGHCWRSRDELIRDVLLWIPTHAAQSRTTSTNVHSAAVWGYRLLSWDLPGRWTGGRGSGISVLDMMMMMMISIFSGPLTPSGFPRTPRSGVAFPTHLVSNSLEVCWQLLWHPTPLNYIIIQRPHDESTEKDIETRLTKAWTAINRLSTIWKSDLTDKMKRSFFQAAVTSILLYGCTTWTLTKRLEKKLDGNYTRMLRAILNKSWRQHPTRHQLYGHLPPITKTIQVRRTRHAGHCWRSRDELIRDVLLWIPHTAAQKQDDQHERTFSSCVRIQVVVLKTYLGRWTIWRSGGRGSGICQHDMMMMMMISIFSGPLTPSGVSENPLGRVWLSQPHLVSNSLEVFNCFGTQLHSII